MSSNYFIIGFVLVPLLGFLISLFIPANREKSLASLAFYLLALNGLALVVFSFWWLISNPVPMNFREWSLYDSKEYTFVIDFYFDAVSCVYLLVGALISLLVVRFSRYYLHREPGYKRYFNTILFFYLAYNFTVLSGNFETLFAGWEMLGISSFLLIAFYRDRYLPVRNSLKVFSIYRIGDVGILLAMWGMHHLWHQNIFFSELVDSSAVSAHISKHVVFSGFIGLSILLAASAKSALVPFSSWLPRAMEGPTPSSAIFYGSLSVHFGLFLLMRTEHFWQHLDCLRWTIGILGFFTAAIGFLIARVQVTVKSQIAYASITQIGIMVLELALGLEKLVLFHFAGNAFLRTYQLLVSPSVISYVIRDQTYHAEKEVRSNFFNSGRLACSYYLLALKEWNLEAFLNRVVFSNIKLLGRRLDFLTPMNVAIIVFPLYALGVLLLVNREQLPADVLRYLPGLFAFFAMIMVFKSFSERRYPRLAWVMVVMAHFWVYLSISFNEMLTLQQSVLYLGGVISGGILGLVILNLLRKKEREFFDLNAYYGHYYEYPRLAALLFIAVLSVMGFPVSSTFLGEDLVFSHIHEDQYVLAIFNSTMYIVGGISLIRIFARLFWGPHVKTYHSRTLKSA